MKIAIAFLLVCFVSGSYQERYNRPHYVPLYYADGLPAGYDVVDMGKVESRNNQPVKRLLGNLLPTSLLPSLSPPITITVTTTSVVPSTVTTAVVVNCLPTTLFTATDSTAACTAAARRRRQLEINDDELSPSQPLPVEPSALPEEAPAAHDELIESSKSEEAAPSSMMPVYQLPRAASLITTTKLVTAYSTSVTFVPTMITSTRQIAVSSALLCLPQGYVVCK